MHVYRIAKQAFVRDLTGEGARLYGGRWNRCGTAVLYTAESRSLAAVEYLVHLPLRLAPPDLCIAELEVPDVPQETITSTELPEDWNFFPAPDSLADITEKWHHSGRSLYLRVPSAVIPHEWNVLINPEHSQANKVAIISIEPFTYDTRLVSGTHGFSTEKES